MSIWPGYSRAIMRRHCRCGGSPCSYRDGVTRRELGRPPLAEASPLEFDERLGVVGVDHPVEAFGLAAGAAGLGTGRGGGGLNRALSLALNLASSASRVALSLALASS